MQLSQACPRCGYNQITNFHKGSVRLVEGYIPQYLAMSPAHQAIVLALGPFFIIQLIYYVLHDHHPGLMPPDMNPGGQYFFLISDFLGLVCTILFVFGLIPYFLAPRVKGWNYRCGNCKFFWSEMENNHSQTFEHIRYTWTRYNQAHIIEGVSCPKSECNSTAIRSMPAIQNYTYNSFYTWSWQAKPFKYLLYFLSFVVVAEIFLDDLRDALGLVPFGLLVLLNITPYTLNLWLSYQKVQNKGRSYVCLNCNTIWYGFIYQPHITLVRYRWYEEALQRSRQKSDQSNEARALVYLAAVIGGEQGDWQQATQLLKKSAELYAHLGITLLPTIYYLCWANSLMEANELEEAETTIRQGLDQVSQEKNWPDYKQIMLALQGEIYLKGGKLEEARQTFRDNLTLFRKIEGYQPRSEPVALRGLAEIALKEGMVVQALQLCGAYQAMLDQAGVILIPKEQDRLQALIEAARARLDTPTYLATWREGSQMSFDQALEYAFRLTAAPLG